MNCSSCSASNEADAVFCEECGASFGRECPSCGTSCSPRAKFCRKCRTPLDGDAAAKTSRHDPRSGSRGAQDGERKTITALFADIKGSMELIEDLDPEEARAIVDPALKIMMDAVHRYEGYVAQSTGDGIFALFGAPVAHEEHPRHALYAALRMQEEIRRYSDRLRAEGRQPIQVRVGANTGEVVVRSVSTGEQVEYVPVGHSTGLAARMQALAPIGSIAITRATQRLVEGYFQLKALGPARVKGVSEPVEVYEVTGLGPLRTRLQRSASRGYTRFVGRSREMEAMKAAAEQAKFRHGQIVAAMAEAGVGKSRLFFEFKAASQSGWLVLETCSVSHGKASAYLPVIDLLHSYFKIAGEDDPRARREKVNGKVLTLDRSLEDAIPHLFALLGISEGVDSLAQMDVQIRQRRTLETIKRILLRESLNQPLMVIFEDLHWIDEATQDLLNLLADSIATTKILLLVNYRPEYSHSWGSKTYYTQLRLDPLGLESAGEMLSALVGDGAELAPLKQLIIEKTEGNPLFMEEMVQALFDEGALVRNGSVKLAKSLSEIKIPPTVQGIIAERIDRLPPAEKELLQTLAVVGMDFPASLVGQVVTRPEAEIQPLLSNLQLAEFVYERPAFPDIEYTFKHALTHDVTYNSVLIERRKLLHERVGAALEKLYVNSIDDHLDELAHHYSRSGNLPKALEYYDRAGRQAVQRSAYADAMRGLIAALELLRRLRECPERDQQELGLQTTLGHVLMITKGWAAPETERVYLRAQELAKTGGTAAQRFSLLTGLFGTAYTGGRLPEARDWLEQIRAFTSQQREPEFLLELHHYDWSVALSTGELEAAQRHVEDGLAFYEAQPGSVPVSPYAAHHPAVCGHAWGAIVSWLLGYPEAARRHTDQAISLAHQVGHSCSLAFALVHKAHVHQLAREVRAALETAEAAMALAEKDGFTLYVSWAEIVKGCALAYLGQAEQGVAQIREGLALATATGTEMWHTYNQAQLAEACGKAGRIDEGLEAITEALSLSQQNGERWWEAEIHRLRAELLLKQNPSDLVEAQPWLERAIEIARKQLAKSPELRATTSLARLLRSRGHCAEARAILVEIYNWFTEGFDTADLKDAKALLEELS